MCYGCWDTYGSPKLQTPDVLKAAKLIGEVYEHSAVGGNAHIVLDDWNLEKHHIDWCLSEAGNFHEAGPEQLKAEKDCLQALQAMSLRKRASALALHEGLIGARA